MSLNKCLKISFYVSLALIIATCTMLVLAFNFEFDAQSGYFNNNGVFSLLATAFFIIGCAAAFIPLAVRKDASYIISPDAVSKGQKNGFAILGTCCILFGAIAFCLNNGAKVHETVLYLAGAGIMSFGSYLLLILRTGGYSRGIAKMIFAFASVLFPVAITLNNNSNYRRSINSVENILSAVFCAAFMLFILYEERRIVNANHQPLHFVSTLLLFFTGMSFSVPYIISFLLGDVNEGFRLLQALAILLISISSLLSFLRVVTNSVPVKKDQKNSMLGNIVKVNIDRPIGSAHPDHPDILYTANYGHIDGIIAGDGEEQDAYVLGIEEPIDVFTGAIAAIIHRKNDIEDKWVVIPENTILTAQDVQTLTHFQEQYFDIEIIM